jgi:hypothetical protein
VKGVLTFLNSVLWIVIRFFKKRDDPEAVRRREQNEIDKAVVSGDGDSVNVMLNDDLERLRTKSRRPEQ